MVRSPISSQTFLYRFTGNELEPETGIAIAAQAMVGGALIVMAIASILLMKRLSELSPSGWSGVALGIVFAFLTGIALLLPSVTHWLTPYVALLFSNGLEEREFAEFAWISAAVVAPFAAIAVCLLIRAAIEMPSRADLEHRVAAHRRTLEKLRETRKDLEERVAVRSREVYEAKKRLEIALRDTNITVSMQDLNLRYVWIRNAPSGFDAQYMLGRTDEEILSDDMSQETMALKQRVIDTGEEERAQVVVQSGTQLRYFDLTAEPYHNEDGSIAGILSIAVEVTEQKEREERLRNVLREMSHRSKNTLTILLGIARQTAQRSKSLPEFLASFDARLRALVGSQDLLVEHDWRAIPLDELVRTQIKPYLDGAEKRLHLDGPSVRIRAEPAQNLGLALHELARNAQRFGALSDTKGQINVFWALDPADDPDTLKITWQEKGGPEVIPPTSPPGFGQTMTERILSRALDGHAVINYLPQGVVCKIDVSMAHVET